MDTNPTPQEMNDPGRESEEDEELTYILDEADGPSASFQKYYDRFKEKFKSIKRAKANRKKQKGVSSEPNPEPVMDKHDDDMENEPSPKPAVDEHEYDFSNAQRGMAIIINNQIFLKEAEMKDRKGSGNDASALEDMFKHLEFHVKRYDNLTAKQMVLTLQEAASNTIYDHGEADCFTCAILSHGGEEIFQPRKQRDDPTIRHDVVFGVDGKMIPTRYLLSIFNDECCPELEGKPRLFFIQACRGGKFDSGTTLAYLKAKTKSKKKKGIQEGEDEKDAVVSGSEEESDSEYYDAEESTEPQEKDKMTVAKVMTIEEKRVEKPTIEEIEAADEVEKTSEQDFKHTTAEGTKGRIVEKGGTRKGKPQPTQGGRGDGRSLITVSPSPIYKDFLLMYAAPPGYFAWRRETGGWLIQSLKKVLMTDIATNQPLTNILTKVTRSAVMDYVSSSSVRVLNKKKLVPCVMSMLTKDVFFRKKVK